MPKKKSLASQLGDPKAIIAKKVIVQRTLLNFLPLEGSSIARNR